VLDFKQHLTYLFLILCWISSSFEFYLIERRKIRKHNIAAIRVNKRIENKERQKRERKYEKRIKER